MKFAVPSTGSSTQTNSRSASEAPPTSSPITPWSGKRSAMRSRSSASIARSVSETGLVGAPPAVLVSSLYSTTISRSSVSMMRSPASRPSSSAASSIGSRRESSGYGSGAEVVTGRPARGARRWRGRTRVR